MGLGPTPPGGAEFTTQGPAFRQWSPFLAAGAFVLVVIALLWIAQERAHRSTTDELVRDTNSARQTVDSRLQANQDFLILLAGLMSSGALDEATFTSRVGAYIDDHRELQNLAWARQRFRHPMGNSA